MIRGGGNVEQPMHSAGRRPRRGRIGEKGGGQFGRHMYAEPLHDAIEVAGPADGDRCRASGIFQNEIPADDPGENLAERHIGVGVGAPRDGNERRKFGVAERDEGAGEPRQHEGDHDAGPGVVRRRRAGQHENAGADDSADSKRHQRRPAERALEAVALGGVVIGDDDVDGLAVQIALAGGMRTSVALSNSRRRERAAPSAAPIIIAAPKHTSGKSCKLETPASAFAFNSPSRSVTSRSFGALSARPVRLALQQPLL